MSATGDDCLIEVLAAGWTGEEQMSLQIDGVTVQTWDNIGGDYQTRDFEAFTYQAEGPITADQIRVVFENDFFDLDNGIDRNLTVDSISIDGEVFQTEDPSTFSTGTWLPEDGVVAGNRESEVLHANGYFEFADDSTPPPPPGDGSTINVIAFASEGTETMELRIDGVVVQTWNNVSTATQTYTYQANTLVTADQIQVALVDAQWDPDNGIDQNLLVDRIEIDGEIFETEDPSTFSTATWKPEDGITPGFRESEALNHTGYFQYADDATPPPPPGDGSAITVFAAGESDTEDFELQIDGVAVASWNNISSAPQGYSFTADTTITADQIRVAFVNAQFDPANNIDENLIVDRIEIDGVIYQTEAATVFSTGTWLPADGIQPGFRQSEFLHNTGYFQYDAQQPENGVIGLGATQYSVNEDDGSVQIQFLRTDGTDGEATVFFETVNGEAISGSDFVGTSTGTATFAAGQSSTTASIGILNDNNLEDIETFTVSIFSVEGAALGVPRTAIVTIVDDEAGRDLVGRWRLDENAIGETVVDSSGRGNDGTHVNIVAPSGGPSNSTPGVDSPNAGSLDFDGSNDYVDINFDDVIDLSDGEFTQSVWIRPTITDNAYHGILGHQPGSTTNRAPGIWVYQGNRIHAGFGDGSNWNSFVTPAALTSNEWNHVATTFNGTTYSAYVNGVEVYSTDAFDGRSPLNISQLDIGRVDNYFEGQIDDVRIYDRALTGSEVLNLLDGFDPPAIPVDGEFVTNVLTSGFDTPVAIDWLPDGRMLVAEQDGVVRLVNADGSINSTPVLDIQDIVNSGTKDRGMLGFAIHPDFDNNPYIYVSYTYDPPETANNSGLAGPDGNGARVARISRFTVDSNLTASASSEVVLVGENSTWANIGDPSVRPALDDPHSCVDENGNPVEDCIPSDELSHTIGDLEFGPDGMLYASSGDGGSFGRVDPINLRSLDLDSLAGKILRIDPITGDGLTDNPFYNGDPDSNESKVYSYGLRNPFRLAVNDDSGEVYIGDVGWTRWEEINTGAGANFGWPAFEGGNGTSNQTGGYQDLAEVRAYYATNPDVTAPLWARLHSDGGRAIIMGDFASDSIYPDQFEGDLFFTDIGDQVLRTVNFDSNGQFVGVETVSSGLGFFVDISMGPDGYLYYVDIATGQVGRLIFQING